jgi:hypothetical protein
MDAGEGQALVRQLGSARSNCVVDQLRLHKIRHGHITATKQRTHKVCQWVGFSVAMSRGNDKGGDRGMHASVRAQLKACYPWHCRG